MVYEPRMGFQVLPALPACASTAGTRAPALHRTQDGVPQVLGTAGTREQGLQPRRVRKPHECGENIVHRPSSTNKSRAEIEEEI